MLEPAVEPLPVGDPASGRVVSEELDEDSPDAVVAGASTVVETDEVVEGVVVSTVEVDVVAGSVVAVVVELVLVAVVVVVELVVVVVVEVVVGAGVGRGRAVVVVRLVVVVVRLVVVGGLVVVVGLVVEVVALVGGRVVETELTIVLDVELATVVGVEDVVVNDVVVNDVVVNDEVGAIDEDRRESDVVVDCPVVDGSVSVVVGVALDEVSSALTSGARLP